MRCTASFRLYEELNEYLSSEKRKVSFDVTFKASSTIGEAIRSLGIPPDEVDLVLVNGESVPFGHIINDGDMISIYPIFESLDISGVTRLRDEPLMKLVQAFKNPNSERRENGKEKDR
jgi:sulfur carrier protein ThiS